MKFQIAYLFDMKVFYIFIIFTGCASSRIEFDSKDEVCLNDPAFCSCESFSITCDCQYGNKTIGNLSNTKDFITIKNCQQLIIPQGSFKGRQLGIMFKNIKNLTLAAGSFETPHIGRLNITISDSNLSELLGDVVRVSSPRQQDPRDSIQPSSGRGVTPTLVFHVTDSEIGKMAPAVFARHSLFELTITNTTIGHIDKGAINNEVQRTVSFINNTFVSLGKQAITIKRSNGLVFDGNTFEGNVPQFLEGTINGDVHIGNNSFPKLKVSPWKIKAEGYITVQGNTFEYLPRHGMDFTVHHYISLVENNIHHLGSEAFILIVPEGKKTIIFMDRNKIHEQEPMSLCLNAAFSPNSVLIKHVRFQQMCECNITNTLSRALDIKNLTIEAIYKNGIHKQWFTNGECILKPQGIEYISIDHFLYNSCFSRNDSRNDSLVEILVAFACILVIIAVCVIVGCRRMRKTTSDINASAAGYHSYTEPCPPSTVPGSWLAVQPETRTYQETEIHVVFDKAQELTDDDDKTNKLEKDDAKITDMKRTPSPSTRQSCPTLPLSTRK